MAVVVGTSACTTNTSTAEVPGVSIPAVPTNTVPGTEGPSEPSTTLVAATSVVPTTVPESSTTTTTIPVTTTTVAPTPTTTVAPTTTTTTSTTSTTTTSTTTTTTTTTTTVPPVPDPLVFDATVAQASVSSDGRADWAGNRGAAYVWRIDRDPEAASATLEWDLATLHGGAAVGARGVEVSIGGNYSVELDTNRQSGNSAGFSVGLAFGRDRSGGSFTQIDTDGLAHRIGRDDALEFVNQTFQLRTSGSLGDEDLTNLTVRLTVRCEATGGEGFNLSRSLCDAEGRDEGIVVGDLRVRYTFD